MCLHMFTQEVEHIFLTSFFSDGIEFFLIFCLSFSPTVTIQSTVFVGDSLAFISPYSMRTRVSKRKGTPVDVPIAYDARLFSGRIDRDFLAVFAKTFELHDARDSREERIVATLLDIGPRVDLGSPLAVEDAAGGDEFPVARLGA